MIKKLGGNPGAIAVLHTDSRGLDFHPHIHVIMPGASIDSVKCLWFRKQGKYLFDHKALALVFKAKFLGKLADKGLSLPQSYSKKRKLLLCNHKINILQKSGTLLPNGLVCPKITIK